MSTASRGGRGQLGEGGEEGKDGERGGRGWARGTLPKFEGEFAQGDRGGGSGARVQERLDGDGRDLVTGANSRTNLARVQERLDGDGRDYLPQANTVYHPQANTVFCGNLAFDVDEQSLLQVMSKCGEVFLMCS
jgi:hypothetical protein